MTRDTSNNGRPKLQELADLVDLEAIRARHVEMTHWEKADDGVLTYVVDGCAGCSSASPNGFQVEWPCDAVRLVDALTASEAARQEALALVAELTDPDPCWYDHHGYCQAHNLAKKPCPHSRAQRLLSQR